MALSKITTRAFLWAKAVRDRKQPPALLHSHSLLVILVWTGIDGIPHKGSQFQPRDHNAVVGAAWGGAQSSTPTKVCAVATFTPATRNADNNVCHQQFVSENERDHIRSDFTVPAPDHTHGKRHYGAGVQEDHIGAHNGFVQHRDSRVRYAVF